MSVASNAACETSLDPSTQLMGLPDPEPDPWYLKNIIGLSVRSTICQTESCGSFAVALWCTQRSRETWYTCESCQETDFGGWPEGHRPPVATLPPVATIPAVTIPAATIPAATIPVATTTTTLPVATLPIVVSETAPESFAAFAPAPSPLSSPPNPQSPKPLQTPLSPPAMASSPYTSSSLPQSLLTHGDNPIATPPAKPAPAITPAAPEKKERKPRRKSTPFSKEEVNAICWGVQQDKINGKKNTSWDNILSSYSHIFQFRLKHDLQAKYSQLKKKETILKDPTEPPPAPAPSSPPLLHPDMAAAPTLTPDPTLDSSKLSSVPTHSRPGTLVLCPKTKDGILKGAVMKVISQSKNWVKCEVQGKLVCFPLGTLDLVDKFSGPVVPVARVVAPVASIAPVALVASVGPVQSVQSIASASKGASQEEDEDDMSAMTEESR
ncbi:hypothetical protein TrVE_jg9244 [Triparma verrucosa]|uniref:Uncharacterized protein n=1 Tax=Triparma verrucosa TaxID=1606542 RepID=A0A9W7BN59_9STRA|nr:hypothetical protein TrVE_jg9244 [Triparma verrucosa]